VSHAIVLVVSGIPERWTPWKGGVPVLVPRMYRRCRRVSGGDWEAEFADRQDAYESSAELGMT